MSDAGGPVRLIDLDRPIHDLDGPTRVVRPLVRLHGRPLGTIELRLPMSGAAVRAAIGRRFGPAIDRHRAADGPPVRGAAPLPASVTVAVTAIAATDELSRVLHGLADQEHTPDEIIVVDNRPATSGLAELVRCHGRGVRYVAEERRGLSWARNAGLAAASGEIVVFCDDDVVLDRGWLGALVAGFDSPDVGCVTGLILPLELDTDAQRWMEQFGGYDKGYRARRFDLTEHRDPSPLYPFNVGVFGSGANTAFRTGVLRGIGGFDVHLGTGTRARGGEDLDIFLELLADGQAINYRPAAVIWHAHHRDRADLRRQIYSYGVGLGAAMAKRLTTRPRERRALLRRVPVGMLHLLGPGSTKNAGKAPSYPLSLTVLELCGVAAGPIGYWRSRRKGGGHRALG